MIKNAAVVLGALLLSAVSLPSFAQSNNTDEGRPHISNAPTRELTRMCKAEAKDKQLSGKERTRFMRDCQSNQVAPSSGASSSASGAKSSAAVSPDPDGRPQGNNAKTSRFNKGGASADTGRASSPTTNVDADGKPRAR